MSMSKELHVTERIDKALNILENIPGLRGFAQWNPVCETMRLIAGVSQDIQKWEQDHAEPVEADEIHAVEEETEDAES